MVLKSNNNNKEGTRPLTGPALPNLINAVKMFKVKIKTALVWMV